jgi:hypothetical protein
MWNVHKQMGKYHYSGVWGDMLCRLEKLGEGCVVWQAIVSDVFNVPVLQTGFIFITFSHSVLETN